MARASTSTPGRSCREVTPWSAATSTARKIAGDGSIAAVIGPGFSRDVFDAGTARDETLQQVSRDAYLGVQGSHVTVYNGANFGDLDQVKLREFLEP